MPKVAVWSVLFCFKYRLSGLIWPFTHNLQHCFVSSRIFVWMVVQSNSECRKVEHAIRGKSRANSLCCFVNNHFGNITLPEIKISVRKLKWNTVSTGSILWPRKSIFVLTLNWIYWMAFIWSHSHDTIFLWDNSFWYICQNTDNIDCKDSV